MARGYNSKGIKIGEIQDIDNKDATILLSGSPETMPGIPLPDPRDYSPGTPVIMFSLDRNSYGVICESPYAI